MVPPLWFYFRWKVAAHIINQIIPKPFLASLEQKWLWLSKKEWPGKGLAGQRIRLMQRNPRQSWILDYSPWIPESLELRFRIPIVSGIPDSYRTLQLYSGFHKQNFPGFWNPYSLIHVARESKWGLLTIRAIFAWPWNENARKKQKQPNGNRVIWLVYRTGINARGFWLVKRTLGWKNFMPENHPRPQKDRGLGTRFPENFLEINRYFALMSYATRLASRTMPSPY